MKDVIVVFFLIFAIVGSIFTYSVRSSPVLPDKPKEIDWEGLWKAAKDPNLTISLTIHNLQPIEYDGQGQPADRFAETGAVGVFLVDGDNEHKITWFAFFPPNKPASFVMGFESTLLSLTEAPSKNAKIVVKNVKDKLAKFEKIEFEVTSRNEDKK